MISIDQLDDLEVMKAQMQVLKRHLADNEIVSNEMLEATVKARVRSLTSRRVWNIVGIVINVAIMVLIVVCMHNMFSTVFLAATTVWCLFWIAVNISQYRDNMRDALLTDTLIDTAQKITRWRRQNSRHFLAAMLASVVWIGFLMREIWGDIIARPDHAVGVAIIIVFVMANVIKRYRKVEKTTEELLEQIKSL